MASAQTSFSPLVEKLERFSQENPEQYRLRVALLAILGYAYIFLVLAGLMALIGALIFFMVFSNRISAAVIKASIFLLLIIWVIVQSLWVTFPKPEGQPLSRQQVPQLFDLVDELTTSLQAPRFHKILLNEEFNAAVIQVPRLGIFGWQENYLLLGLPLMQALSLEQFKAVLAHELGHLSGNHSRFAAWIYRIRKTWLQIYERLGQRKQLQADILFNWFLGWYWPFFNAYSFTLARMNEYEADRCSAKLAGANNAAAALINVEIKARFLSSCFWVNIHQQAADQPEPPNNTYSLMLSTLSGPIAEDQTQAWLQNALTQQTDYVDTHPCLSDRLSALGYSTVQSSTLPQLSERQTSAAEHLLGNRVNDFAIAFDQTWQTTASTSWRQRYAYLQEAKDQLQALERKAQQAPLTIQEKWERAAYIWELQGDDAALPLLQEVIGLAPDHASANYTIGQVLLNKGDDAGIGYIEKAIAQRIDWRIKGYQLIAQFFWQQGQTKAAETYREKADQHYQQLLKAEEERTNVSHRDTFKPHTLTPSEINDLKQQLATHPQVRAAYLVEKVVTHFPEERLCVLGVIRKQQFIESTEAPQQVVDLLVNHLQTPVQTYIVILNHGSFKKLKQKIGQIDQSLIFKR